MFLVHAQFTNVVAGHILQPKGPRFGTHILEQSKRTATITYSMLHFMLNYFFSLRLYIAKTRISIIRS